MQFNVKIKGKCEGNTVSGLSFKLKSRFTKHPYHDTHFSVPNSTHQSTFTDKILGSHIVKLHPPLSQNSFEMKTIFRTKQHSMTWLSFSYL